MEVWDLPPPPESDLSEGNGCWALTRSLFSSRLGGSSAVTSLPLFNQGENIQERRELREVALPSSLAKPSKLFFRNNVAFDR